MTRAKSDLPERPLCPGSPGQRGATGSNVRRAAAAYKEIANSLCARGRPSMFCVVVLTAIAQPAVAQEKAATEEFACLIQPKMVLKLGTPVPGLLSEVLVDRGTIVKKGDVIARLESG